MRLWPALGWAIALALAGCGDDPGEDGPAPSDAASAGATALVDQALLADLLGEAAQVEGELVRADGLLIRLAFEPLIRQTGPASLQQVQGQGYRLANVAEGSPLWQLGLREGDVLTTVDGQAILGREHELRSAWERRPGRAELGYSRGEQAHVLRLQIRAGAAWQGESAEARAPLSTDEPLRPPLPSRDPTFALDLADKVHCTDDGEQWRCEIERGALDLMLANPAQLARQARVVPAVREGTTVGFKLYGIRSASLASLLGLNNGDMVTSVDGRPLESIDAAMNAYMALRQARTFDVTIERKGQPRRLQIEIVDGPG